MAQDLKIALIHANVSQIELATRVGVHPSTLSRITNGWLMPTPEIEAAIRRALGVHGRGVRFGTRCTGRRQRGNERGAARTAVG